MGRESIVFLLMIACVPVRARAEITVKDAIDLFDGAANAIGSFDVHIHMTARVLAKKYENYSGGSMKLVGSVLLPALRIQGTIWTF